jgi:hypothetical protein
VNVPNAPGKTRTPLQPQIGIAPGDIASFNVRLVPAPGGKPRKTFKEFALEILVSGSAGAEVRTPMFHVDLLT